MICICGRSEICEIRPDNTDIILCPICRSKYHYVWQKIPKLLEKGNIEEDVKKFDKETEIQLKADNKEI